MSISLAISWSTPSTTDYEAAVVVSNDSDLAEPIRLVRQKFGKKVLGYASMQSWAGTQR